MAKKVTIEGTNKLSNLTDAWGGTTGENAETIYGISVPSNSEWGMNRGEVERFIKAQFGVKAGWLVRTEDNNLLAFATEDDYISWQTDPDNNPPLASVALPNLTQEDVYQVRVILESIPNELQRSRDVSVNVRGTSVVQLAVGGSEDISETLDVLVETSPTGASGTWASRKVGTIQSNSLEYRAFSLQNYLSVGTNYVRIRVRGQGSGEPITSIPVSFTINVVDLYLIPRTDFESPVSEVVTLSYLIGGSIDKIIDFQFGTGRGENFQSSYSTQVALGTQTNTQTAKQFQFDRSDLLTAGRHSVRARLYVNETMYTDWVESEYMVAGDSKMVIVNDIQTGLSNWTAVKFFDWAAYSPTNEEFNVVFKLYDENDSELYTSWIFSAQNGQKYSFTTQLSLNIPDNISVFGGVMHIEDEEGNTLCPSVSFNFINSAEFSPVSGADFVMIPANRSNSESSKATIINEAGSTPSVVGSTFTGFGWLNDGWINVPKDLNDDEAGTLRALHIPAGHKVEINYNPFSDFTGNSNSGYNATFELDFRTSNILDDEEPVVRIGTLVNDKIWGFEMLPTKAYMLTSENNTIEDQDVDWAEDVRTHLAVNIVTVVYSNTTLNYVRMFINGVIEREFLYTTSDRFTAASGVKIELGNSSCDLDVFGIRNYRIALTTADVMKDYMASMDSVEEKLAFKEKNDITVNDAINFARCIEKGYNVIGHTGPLPKYGKADGNPTYTGVTLQIHINGDTEHSGILTNLEAKGQGTTAMTYYDWNQSYKITKTTKHLTEEGMQKEIEDGKGYAIAGGEYKAKKLVGKINFASSMQSHKLGLTWIFTEVFKELVEANTISRPSQMVEFPDSRIAVFEKPFLFFHRETENDDWTYKYLMTFGAGKGDKPTFGFDEEETGNMMMVEGADNDPALCNFAMPWDNSVVYNPSKEAWYVGATKSINFGFGVVREENGEEIPDSTAALNAIKGFWNFVYEHHTGINFYNGSLQNLKDGEPLVGGSNPVRNSGLYWIAVSGANQYDLFRYDSIDGWIPAGANKTTLNMREHYKTLDGSYPSWSGKTNKQINDEIIALRRAHFKANAESYFHVDDALYHSCFIKLFAGTDNRAKNTYYYTDPVTLKIRWMQDDLDTVIKTNNLGQNRKPYYVEEHDTDAYGAYYWQGERNAFYNLLEECYLDDSNTLNDRMGAMMRSMLGVMSSIGVTVMGYLLQRLIFVQDYFPAIAYNEQARLVYEAAQAAQTGSNPVYGNSIQAITQSCGSQRWSEYQWLLDRIMYISSWCAYGEFAEGTVSSGALSWRSDEGDFNFVLTPAKWMYPKIGKGTSNLPAASSNGTPLNRVRCQPKVPFSYLQFSSEGDTDIYLRGIHYMLDIGDMNVYLKPAPFGFIGRRLQEINVNPNGTDSNRLAASSITNTATNIKSLVIRNVASVSGTLNLSQCYRLEKIDIRGSSFTGISLPNTERLTSLKLPATLTALVIENAPNLGNTDADVNAGVSLEGAANLTRVRITGSPYVASYAIINSAKNASAALTEVVLHDISWSNVDASVIDWLASISTCELTGTIAIDNSTPVTFELRRKMLDKWGDAISSGALTFTYTLVNLGSAQIGGDRYISQTGSYPYVLIPNSDSANNFSSIVWSVEWGVETPPADLEDVVEINPKTGVLLVKQVFNSTTARINVIASVDSLANPVTYDVGLFYREAEVGDFVFANGSWSDENDPSKTVVGICTHVYTYTNAETGDTELMRLMVCRNNPTTYAWGLRNSSNGVSGLSTNIEGQNPYNIAYIGEDNSGFVNYTSGRWGALSAIKIVAPYQNEYHDVGEYAPTGFVHTRAIINCRDIVIRNLTSETYPLSEVKASGNLSEYAVLTNLLNAMSDNYKQFYYPAASYCYAYNPKNHYTLKSGEVLADKFKEHNWFLPDMTVMWDLLKFHRQLYDEANLGVSPFKKAINLSLFTRFVNDNTYDVASYWSTREAQNGEQANYGIFSSGQRYRSDKSNKYRVRPMCRF